MGLTLFLVALLGTVFLLGFREAIGLAVVLVALYVGMSLLVMGAGLFHLLGQPELLGNWSQAVVMRYPSPAEIALASALVFPRLALGLSGFETGVAVMPLSGARQARARRSHRGVSATPAGCCSRPP